MTPEELTALLDAPAEAPPDGVDPTLDAADKPNAMGMAITVVMMALTTIAAVRRLYSRVAVLKVVRVYKTDMQRRFHIDAIESLSRVG
jgi:hypothetical protein